MRVNNEKKSQKNEKIDLFLEKILKRESLCRENYWSIKIKVRESWKEVEI